MVENLTGKYRDVYFDIHTLQGLVPTVTLKLLRQFGGKINGIYDSNNPNINFMIVIMMLSSNERRASTELFCSNLVNFDYFSPIFYLATRGERGIQISDKR